jgi:pyrroline-5-carboxylate reductase
MGGAVLNGILAAAFTKSSTEPKPITNFIACTKSASSAARIKSTIAAEHQDIIKVVSGQNVQTMKEADIVILGCKPFMADDVLREEGVREALAGKLVISMLAGQSCEKLTRIIKEGPLGSAGAGAQSADPAVMKVIPNMGAQFGESMTIIETPSAAVSSTMAETAEWIFNQVGKVKYLAPEQTGLATVLVGATLATLTLPIEGLLDGCVAEGFRRADAMEMVLQGIRGLSAVLESGAHPAVVRESISSPRGCTIQTLLSLEKAGTRSDFAEAMIRGNKHLKENM